MRKFVNISAPQILREINFSNFDNNFVKATFLLVTNIIDFPINFDESEFFVFPQSVNKKVPKLTIVKGLKYDFCVLCNFSVLKRKYIQKSNCRAYENFKIRSFLDDSILMLL